jgi:dihydropteroate synthase
MKVRRYLRPLSLCFGDDARRLIESGSAGPLGGLEHIAFSLVEVIERGTSTRRSIVPFSEVESMCAAVTRARIPIAGLTMDKTRLMGIVNVTPDSFSDGGKFDDAERGIAHAQQLLSDGADFLDIGGESTRPGSDPVSEADEIARVTPVIAALAGRALVSADTRKSSVMRACAAVGAAMINDVSGLAFDPHSGSTVAELGLSVVIMHAQGEPKTMQLAPKYDDVALDVYDVLETRIAAAEAAGIPRDRIIVDPGIGFGKTFSHNLDVLAKLTVYHGLGVSVLVGASRKAFIGALTRENVAANRISGSLGVALQASLYGAHILRVHDVKQTKQSLSVFWASLDPNSAEL